MVLDMPLVNPLPLSGVFPHLDTCECSAALSFLSSSFPCLNDSLAFESQTLLGPFGVRGGRVQVFAQIT